MNPQNAHAHEDRLLDFAYGELPTPEARAMEAHLSGCARCTQALDDIRGVRATMSQLSTEPAPDAGLESLMAYAQQAARRAAAGPAPKPSRWRRWLLPVLGVASVSTFGILILEANEHAPASPSPAQVAAKVEMARAKDAAPARGVAEPVVASAEAPAPPPPPTAQAAPSPKALLDEGAAKEVARAEDWRNAGSGGGLDARIVREEEMKAKPGYGKGASERARASTNRQPLAKTAPSKASKFAFGEKDAPDEESLAESAPRDDSASRKQEGLKLGGASAAQAQAADEDDGAFDKVFAGGDAPQAVGSVSVPAGPPAPATAAPASPSPSPSGGRADVATGALAQTESLAERRAPAPAQAPTKKAKRSESPSPAAEMPASRAQAEPGPSVAELSSQARDAYLAGDRALEAGLLRSALAAGPSGSERLGLLNRLCDAELALGRQAAGAAACKQVIADAPGSSAAQAARRRLSREPAILEAAPKSADPQK
ncbi:anti-sigma factor family protein [Pyxidicoccus sp. MSG2]|uniref:anti-sigma factor family protein n=1 Tax=Pyxidicoccus sp. MSG2 TaxID=2996790 RepID=UPI002271C412|nr:zf-HC2 domain-containing protein [Pyxidicoccus sp. MSG2]MCY1021970.1 zf-HC2 domain-containing protein [Pyxidicoccus sp. MSG2]